MRRIVFMSVTLISVALLSACGPIYKTEYAYTPPASSMGQMCVSQCLQNKSVNEQMCQMRNDACRSQARQNAMYQFEAYRNERKSDGKKVRKDLSDFDQSYLCSDSCDSTPTFNACYSACGGQVLERQICTAFCNQ